MGKLADAAKSPLTVRIDGRDYILSPLELADFGELERWLETLPYERARRKITALGEVMTPELRDAILKEADDASKRSGFGHSDNTKFLSTIEGMGFLLWLSLRKRQPEITREDALHLVSLESVTEWQQKLDRLSGLDNAGEETTDRPTEPEAAT